MLQKLRIENYVLIDRLDVALDKGFSVITGETGAGKSVLLGALSLILGQRAETRVVKEGTEKCVVEAEFDVRAYFLKDFFEQNDLEFSPEYCLIRREIYASGKSRAFVNDSPVSLGILRELTTRLVDIHSQHQNLLIGNDSFQLTVLDAVARNSAIRDEYRQAFFRYQELKNRLSEWEEMARKSRVEEDYLRFQYHQLCDARLRVGEQEELESEWAMLTHAEEIKQGLGRIYSLLEADEYGVNTSLKSALNQADALQKVYSGIKESVERLRSCYLDMKDLTGELGVRLNDVEVSPERMEEVDGRLNELYKLQQKHRVGTVDELATLRDELARKLAVMDSYDDSLADLKKQLMVVEKDARELAQKITDSRGAVGNIIEERLVELLVQLGMPKAVIRIEYGRKSLEADGQDRIQWLFSANKNVSPQPVQQIASGGEMSRIMLSIKSLIADYAELPTLLFDEIDTGVSGEIAHRMGQIMKGISRRRQVICITHLPQIAAKGKDHFKVYKTERNNHSVTLVRQLSGEERLLEIAQMLSGANVSEAAIRNANALLLENQ